MLFILGIDSQFCCVESLMTALVDNWPRMRPIRAKFTFGMVIFMFILGLPMITQVRSKKAKLITILTDFFGRYTYKMIVLPDPIWEPSNIFQKCQKYQNINIYYREVFISSNWWIFMPLPECLCYGARSSKPLPFAGFLEPRKCTIALSWWLDTRSICIGCSAGPSLLQDSWSLSSCSTSSSTLLLCMEANTIIQFGVKCLVSWSVCPPWSGFPVSSAFKNFEFSRADFFWKKLFEFSR